MGMTPQKQTRRTKTMTSDKIGQEAIQKICQKQLNH